MGFMCADVRCHLISALHQLMDGNTCCALSEDFALILVVFLSLREAFGREQVAALFAQEHREAGPGIRLLSPTPDPCSSCHGASHRAAGRTCWRPRLVWDVQCLGWFSQALGFQRSIVCQRWVSLGLCKEHPLRQWSCRGPSCNISLCSRGWVESTGPQIIPTRVNPGSGLAFWGPL